MNLPLQRLLIERGKQLDLQAVAGEAGLERVVTSSELNRPGLAFAGFLGVFSHDRIQILGNTEISFLASMDAKDRAERLARVFEFDIPCFIITASNQAPPEMLEMADRRRIPVLRTSHTTSRFWGSLSFYLEREFAPTETIHGVLMDIFGLGVLITGTSGVGKSECGLELIERGHRLVADDVVVIKRLGKNLVMGSAVSSVQHYMEVRGLGIVDVELLFGAGSVRDEKRISLVVHLEKWTDHTKVERLGIDEKFISLLEVEIRQFTIPVEPGRNTSILVEVAALQHRLNTQGRNPAKEMNERLMKQMTRTRLA